MCVCVCYGGSVGNVTPEVLCYACGVSYKCISSVSDLENNFVLAGVVHTMAKMDLLVSTIERHRYMHDLSYQSIHYDATVPVELVRL